MQDGAGNLPLTFCSMLTWKRCTVPAHPRCESLVPSQEFSTGPRTESLSCSPISITVFCPAGRWCTVTIIWWTWSAAMLTYVVTFTQSQTLRGPKCAMKMCPEQQLEQAGWIIEKVSGCCYGRGTFPFMQILLMRLCRKQEVDHVSHLSSVSHLQLHHWMLAKGGLLHLHVICFWLWVFSHISVSVFNLDDSVNTDLWPESPASEFKQKTFFVISLVFFI